jgi:quaternary ammonium compound-resistance protein SugE
MAWVYLFLAGLFEIGWALGLKYSQGFTRLGRSLVTIVSIVISLSLLGLALRVLPLGTAYAVWTGIAAVGTAMLGMLLFAESVDAARLLCVGLIVGGIIGLKLASP